MKLKTGGQRLKLAGNQKGNKNLKGDMKLDIGDIVVIKECHSIPDLVGKEAKVIALVDPEIGKYPIRVVLTEPLLMDTPFGKGEVAGPFPFREDELELKTEHKGDEGIPPVFLEDGKDKGDKEPA